MRSSILLLVAVLDLSLAISRTIDVSSLRPQAIRPWYSTSLLQKRSSDDLPAYLTRRGQKEKKRKQGKQQNVLQKEQQSTNKGPSSAPQVALTQQSVPLTQASSPEAQLSRLSLSPRPKESAPDVSTTKGPFSPRIHTNEPIHTEAMNYVVQYTQMHARTRTPIKSHPVPPRTKEAVNTVRSHASCHINQVPCRSTEKGRSMARKERKMEASAKVLSKNARARTNMAYQNAYRTFSQHEPGSTPSNEAFTTLTRAAVAEREVSWKHVQAMMDTANSLQKVHHLAGALPYYTGGNRAHARARMRDSQYDAVHYGYLASASKNVLRTTDPSNTEERQKAAQAAVAMAREYRTAVGNYRISHKDWQNVRDELSGSSSDESETEFPDVPR